MAVYSCSSRYILGSYGSLVVSLNAMQVSHSLGIGALGGGGIGKLGGGILEVGRVDALGDGRLHFDRSISDLMELSVRMLTEVFLRKF